MLAGMGLLLDSFWRATAYCLHKRVIAWSLFPLLFMAITAWLDPGYGTCTMRVPLRAASSSIVRCDSDPLPMDA